MAVEMPTESTTKKWVTDCGCARYIPPSANIMVNYREYGGVVRIIDEPCITNRRDYNSTYEFLVYLAISLEVAIAPVLGYNLLSLKIIADRDHK